MDMDELNCHAIGERRMNYLNQIKCILDQMDDTPCTQTCGSSRRPLLEFPGYINRRNPEFGMKTFGSMRRLGHEDEFSPACRPEVCESERAEAYAAHPSYRDCANFAEHQPKPEQGIKNLELNMRINLPATGSNWPQQERERMSSPCPSHPTCPEEEGRKALGGEYIGGCDCTKHNGMQDQCRRMECRGNPACLTNPPSCLPARMMPQPKPPNMREKYEAILNAKLSERDRNRQC